MDTIQGNKLSIQDEHEKEMKRWMADNNITGYDILDMPGCPRKLPTARSMTQAKNDYYHLMPALIQWYNTIIPKPAPNA